MHVVTLADAVELDGVGADVHVVSPKSVGWDTGTMGSPTGSSTGRAWRASQLAPGGKIDCVSPLEIELARSAQAGSASALGMLLARHQAGMRAVALSILGYGPDAEDAVQDAVLIALRRIGTLRSAAA